MFKCCLKLICYRVLSGRLKGRQAIKAVITVALKKLKSKTLAKRIQATGIMRILMVENSLLRMMKKSHAPTNQVMASPPNKP